MDQLVEWFERSIKLREGASFSEIVEPSSSGINETAILHEEMSKSDLAGLSEAKKQPTQSENLLHNRPRVQWIAAILEGTTWRVINDGDSCDFGLDLIRRVRYPQYGPYLALGWRNYGLAASKSGDYVLANAALAEGRTRLDDWGRVLGEAKTNKLDNMYLETSEQIYLGSTGTAARTLEHLLTGSFPLAPSSVGATVLWVRAYRSLRQGISDGENASDGAAALVASMAKTLKTKENPTLKGLTEEERFKNSTMLLDMIVRPIWTQRPAVMTARCHFLAVPLCMLLRELEVSAPSNLNWDTIIDNHHNGFLKYYSRAVSKMQTSSPNQKGSTETNHENAFRREIAQLRFAYALLFPKQPLVVESGTCLNSSLKEAGNDALCSEVPQLSELTTWLKEDKSDANIWCSITENNFLRQMKALNPDLNYLALIEKNKFLIRQEVREKVLSWVEGFTNSN